MLKFLLIVYSMALKIIRAFFFLNSVTNIQYSMYSIYSICSVYIVYYYSIYSIVLYYIYIYSICTPSQYLKRGGIETIREYLETRFDKWVSSNSLCHLASFILKNNYFENEELKYHQKRGFSIGTKFALPYSNLFMAGL